MEAELKVKESLNADPNLQNSKNMIELEEIEKIYRTDKIETVALTNVNLNVREGEFISIMGPSGSGKSTLLNVIGLLDVATKGNVSLNGKQISSYKDSTWLESETKRSDLFFKLSILSAISVSSI